MVEFLLVGSTRCCMGWVMGGQKVQSTESRREGGAELNISMRSRKCGKLPFE